MKKLTIEEIEQKLFSNPDAGQKFIKRLKKDDRKGVKLLVEKWLKKQEQEKKLYDKFARMNEFEKRLRAEGFQLIAGVDEVGRGPIAGPVVAAAVILPDGFFLPGIDDSKKLSEAKRDEFFSLIKEQALASGIGMVSPAEIDEINIYEATKKAMLEAVAALAIQPDFLLVDAVKLVTPYATEALIKGDERSVSIAAASIIAKVTRDRMLKEICPQYPEYGFSRNMGYATAEHLAAIKQFGATPYHRKTFAPVKDSIKIGG
ncbi:ribonuclease HII [Bacillus sp. T33-2]|uniref:ribonuclease HII n=1 Tax=Bacillus sp. T33-2 TaxID=2054168 RepID=UPI000C77B5F6|nr:ribonuclease HII [Bacillus sp. T33-2]PLR97293.1 ribonuclease HII [Bacillus sp. T33-2]